MLMRMRMRSAIVVGRAQKTHAAHGKLSQEMVYCGREPILEGQRARVCRRGGGEGWGSHGYGGEGVGMEMEAGR